MRKETISIDPSLIKAEASESFSNKVKITFPLLRTYPAVNANGDTYDYEETKKKYNTITNGYINLEHEQWINVGSVVDATFEEGDEGIIICEAILWKNVLDEFDIAIDDLKNGNLLISMEVYFSDYYIMHGQERIDLPEAEEYVEYRGQSYKGKEVKRVIKPREYSGAALTENPADKTLDILKVAASKLNAKKDKDKDCAMRESALTPNYSGTESSPEWSEVGLTFSDFREGYFKNSDDAPSSIEEIGDTWGSVNQAVRDWIATRALLGNPDADSFDNAVTLPVVNPDTDNLNENGLIAARQRVSQVSGITESAVESVMSMTSNLLEEEFDRDITKEEARDNMFKTFETEEQFNEFKESLKDDLATQLKEDEDFIAEASKGKIEIEEVVSMFQEAGIEDAEGLEDVVEKFNELEQEYAEYKERVAREKKINDRITTLAESGIEFDKLGASENELADMSEEAFKIVLATYKQASEKAVANKEEASFVPQVSLDDAGEELDTKDMIDAL